jgi:cytochrome c-type biogenesis protein CcmH/NrfF
VRRAALPALISLALLAAAPVQAAVAPKASQTEIEGEVMCPVCGTLLELAESPQALREKAFVKRLVAEGRTEAQVKQALVVEYGDAVLALPRGSGFSLSAYLVPIVAFLIAAIALGLGVMRWRRAGGPPAPRGPGPAGPSAEDSDRLNADLARYDL